MTKRTRNSAILRSLSIFRRSSPPENTNSNDMSPQSISTTMSCERFRNLPGEGQAERDDSSSCHSLQTRCSHQDQRSEQPGLEDDYGSEIDSDNDSDEDKEDCFENWISHGDSAICVRIISHGPPKTVHVAPSPDSPSPRSTTSSFRSRIASTYNNIPPLIGLPMPDSVLAWEATRSLAESQVLRECGVLAEPVSFPGDADSSLGDSDEDRRASRAQ